MELNYRDQMTYPRTETVRYGDAYVNFVFGIFDWGGITTRKEFWHAFVMNVAVTIFVSWALNVFNFVNLHVVVDVYSILIYVALSAMVVRRFHSAGLSRWWALFWLVPLVGSIPVLFACMLPNRERGLA